VKRTSRRSLALFSLLVAVATVLGACGRDGRGTPDGKFQVLATTVQIGSLARQVAGEHADVRVLVKAGVDPHDYELSTGDLRAIERASVILRHGIGLDSYLDKAANDAATRAKTIVVTGGIELRVQGGESDPHVWQNPLNAGIMTSNIADALAARDPANANDYRKNAAAYRATLEDADRQIRELVETVPPANRKMVTNHDAFGYFIERYGLQFVGAVIPSLSTQAEPSAKDIAALEDTIRREKVKAIFAESSLEPRTAAQIAKDTGVRIVDDLYGDSLGPPGSGADTVDGMLLANARKIADALR